MHQNKSKLRYLQFNKQEIKLFQNIEYKISDTALVSTAFYEKPPVTSDIYLSHVDKKHCTKVDVRYLLNKTHV